MIQGVFVTLYMTYASTVSAEGQAVDFSEDTGQTRLPNPLPYLLSANAARPQPLLLPSWPCTAARATRWPSACCPCDLVSQREGCMGPIMWHANQRSTG